MTKQHKKIIMTAEERGQDSILWLRLARVTLAIYVHGSTAPWSYGPIVKEPKSQRAKEPKSRRTIDQSTVETNGLSTN
jgi:hypothetical protein